MLPEEIRYSIDNEDWKLYVKLCNRYNLEPIVYLEILKDRYGLIPPIANADCIFKYTKNILTNNFTPLSGISFPLVKALTILDMGRGFGLKGFSEVIFPNLITLSTIKNLNDEDLNELRCFESNSLNHLYLGSDFAYVPPLKLSRLRHLTLVNGLDTDLIFLNSSELANMESLTISTPTFGGKYRIPLKEIDWSRFPNLRDIGISELSYRANQSTIILDGVGDSLSNLTMLYLSNCNIKLSSNLLLPNLIELSIPIQNLEILSYLDIPNIKRITINNYGNHQVSSTEQEIVYRAKLLLGNDGVDIIVAFDFGKRRTVVGYLPEDMKKSLDEKDWPTYMKLSRRYNMRGSAYLNYLETEHLCTINMKRVGNKEGGIQYLMVLGAKDFTFLNGMSLPDLTELSVTRKNMTFNFDGIENIGASSLVTMRIIFGGGNIKALESFRSNTLRDLYIEGRIENVIGRLELESLESLTIYNNNLCHIGFLISSKMPSLRNLYLTNPINDWGCEILLSRIPWENYPKLETLQLSQNYRGLFPIIIDESLSKIDNLKCLTIDSSHIKVKGTIVLNNLNTLVIDVERLEDLTGLNVPNLEKLYIKCNNLEYDEETNNLILREILNNNKMVIDSY